MERTDEEFGQHGRAPHPELGRRAPLVTVRGGREAGGSPRFADHDPCDDGEERHGVFKARAFLDGLSEEEGGMNNPAGGRHSQWAGGEAKKREETDLGMNSDQQEQCWDRHQRPRPPRMHDEGVHLVRVEVVREPQERPDRGAGSDVNDRVLS